MSNPILMPKARLNLQEPAFLRIYLPRGHGEGAYYETQMELCIKDL
jgi:hypothetical protein